MSPREWLTQQRIQATLPLLQLGAIPVESVARAVGFDAPSFRRHFRRSLGVSPAHYRRAFLATAGQPVVSVRVVHGLSRGAAISGSEARDRANGLGD